ncbi:MAG TPA: hypothetical protein VGQ52_03015 [Gemmatimonadaceae bacterium]|nr:hypothetical protein [Gemmatimonadaceae bacterium]
MSYYRFDRRRMLVMAAAFAAAGTFSPAPAAAQWSTTYEQFYLPGKFNWQFRRNYPAADRLFNAFDFGHAILYETLWTNFDGSIRELEEGWYNRLTKGILPHPPRVPLEEAAIEIDYAKLVPEAKMMFDWAHLFHRQIYDVWADERMQPNEKDAKVAELLRYYKSRPDIAFSAKPKSMALMQEQRYSLAFRKSYPKFNGLIWAYHWLQVGLYEPLVVGRSVDERQAGVRAALSRFWQMLQDPPRTMPYVMPMTAAVAPEFAKRYAEAAIIFDNLHSMHDVVSDILANPSVSRDGKRAEILLAARRYRDDTSFVMTEQAWRTMAQHMGVENMGGLPLGVLWPLPTPTVTYGAVMTHDERTGEMTGFKYGQATGGEHAQMQHGATPRDSSRRDSTDHARMGHDSAGRQRDTTAVRPGGHQMADSTRPASPNADSLHMEQMMQLHMRMMSDPVIRERIMADTGLRRMMQDMMRDMPAEHREPMEAMMAKPSAKAPAKKPAATKRADPHAGHKMPATKAAPKAAVKKPAAKKDSMPAMDHSRMTPKKKP